MYGFTSVMSQNIALCFIFRLGGDVSPMSHVLAMYAWNRQYDSDPDTKTFGQIGVSID